MSTSTAAKHPKGLYVLFFTEMWERFGYYLMLGIYILRGFLFYFSRKCGNGSDTT